MNLRFAIREVKNAFVCWAHAVGERWYAWDPQPTWQESVRLMVIEVGACLAFIWLFEAIF
jgi:hypothetical protein